MMLLALCSNRLSYSQGFIATKSQSTTHRETSLPLPWSLPLLVRRWRLRSSCYLGLNPGNSYTIFWAAGKKACALQSLFWKRFVGLALLYRTGWNLKPGKLVTKVDTGCGAALTDLAVTLMGSASTLAWPPVKPEVEKWKVRYSFVWTTHFQSFWKAILIPGLLSGSIPRTDSVWTDGTEMKYSRGERF